MQSIRLGTTALICFNYSHFSMIFQPLKGPGGTGLDPGPAGS
jgi:hypothetical protein